MLEVEAIFVEFDSRLWCTNIFSLFIFENEINDFSEIVSMGHGPIMCYEAHGESIIVAKREISFDLQ